jgi:hypothetical protein
LPACTTSSEERWYKNRDNAFKRTSKTSLNDMLISASFRYGQLKSIKNQSHPHLSFRHASVGGKDKLNKTSTRQSRRNHCMGCRMLSAFNIGENTKLRNFSTLNIDTYSWTSNGNKVLSDIVFLTLFF